MGGYVKIDLKEMVYQVSDDNSLVKEWDKWGAVVITAMNHRVL
jgi:hypothetical protein